MRIKESELPGRLRRIAVVDDDVIVLRTVGAMIKALMPYVAVAQIGSAARALENFRKSPPDVVLLDIVMPGLSGIELAAQIAIKFPKVRVVMVTGHARNDFVEDAFTAGAMGYLLKPLTLEDLKHAIQGALDGHLVLSDSLRPYLGHGSRLQARQIEDCELPPPTPRERSILTLAALGKTDSAIGDELGISVNTVKHHIKNVLRKYDVDNRTQAVAVLRRYLGL